MDAYTKSLQAFSTILFGFRNSARSHFAHVFASMLVSWRRTNFGGSLRPLNPISGICKKIGSHVGKGPGGLTHMVDYPAAECIAFNSLARVKGFSSSGIPSLMPSV